MNSFFEKDKPKLIDRIVLELTCGGCPEQYDAYLYDEKVGYLRLRHGYFSVRYPSSCGEEIYSAQPRGDGIFECDERDYYLNEAKKAILQKILEDLWD